MKLFVTMRCSQSSSESGSLAGCLIASSFLCTGKREWTSRMEGKPKKSLQDSVKTTRLPRIDVMNNVITCQHELHQVPRLDQGSTVTWSCSKGMLEYHKPSSTIININLSINLISWDCSSCPRHLLHRIAVKCPELKTVPSVLGRRKQTAPGSTGHLPCARRGMLHMWTSLQCSSNMSCTGEHVYGLSFQSVRCASLQNRTIS